MKVKVIRQFLNGPRLAREGEVIEVGDARAKELEKNKLVVLQLGAAMLPRGREAIADPTPLPPTGGPTGEEKPQSLSRRGRPRKTPLSSLVEGERGSSR